MVEAFLAAAQSQSASADPLVVGIVTALLGGGAVGAVGALMRAPKQGKLDLMNAAKILYEEQETQYQDVKGELEKCRTDIEKCQLDRARLQREVEAERAEVTFLRERITYVEDNMRRRQQQHFHPGEHGVMGDGERMKTPEGKDDDKP